MANKHDINSTFDISVNSTIVLNLCVLLIYFMFTKNLYNQIVITPLVHTFGGTVCSTSGSLQKGFTTDLFVV